MARPDLPKRRLAIGCTLDQEFEGSCPPVPVVAHVTSVAMTIARAGFDEATIAAAFLHDVLEDENRGGQSLDESQLRAAVGESVTNLVVAVTE